MRKRIGVVVAVVVVAVLGLGGVTAAALHRSASARVAADLSGWRYESYDGVQVRVPPDWGWGAAPTSVGGDQLSCGTARAVAVPSGIGSTPKGPWPPFVGRPAVTTDACLGQGSDGIRPEVDAVWLGSPLPAGTDSTGAEAAQTVAVGQQHVTVFSADPSLRSRILATVESVQIDGNGCPTAPVVAPAPGPQGNPAPRGMSVCVYDRGSLLWSERTDAYPAQQYVDAFARASASFDTAGPCTTPPSAQWVAIGIDTGTGDGSQRWDIANFGCDRLVGTYTSGDAATRSPMEAPFTVPTVQWWAGGGIRAYVTGPVVDEQHNPGLAQLFRGMLG